MSLVSAFIFLLYTLMNTPSFRRIMLKLSGEALKWSRDYGFDVDYIDQLAQKIMLLSQQWYEIAIVLWWGNIFRGVAGQKRWMDRATGDYIGMLATVMNGIALWEALNKNGWSARILSSIDMPKIAELFVMKKALHYLWQWKIVICVWWTGNPYFTTDTSAIQKALELKCDIVVKWTKVDGVYDKDPAIHSDAMRFDTLSVKEAHQLGLDIMDHAAIALAVDNRLPLLVCSIDIINRIWQDWVGTYLYN